VKPGYAAALALVGWYLMEPPLRSYENEPFADLRASLSLWQVRGTFDSAIDCAKAREKSQRVWRDSEERNLESAAKMDANLNRKSVAAFEAARRINVCQWTIGALQGNNGVVRPSSGLVRSGPASQFVLQYPD
jgi:hypothetical protein